MERHYKEALVDFNAAIDLDSNNADAYYGRAQVACRSGFTQPMALDISKYIELAGPKMAMAFIGRGLTRFLQQDFKASIADLDVAIAVDPHNIQVYLFKKTVLSESKDTVALGEFLSSLTGPIRDSLELYAPQGYRLKQSEIEQNTRDFRMDPRGDTE